MSEQTSVIALSDSGIRRRAKSLWRTVKSFPRWAWDQIHIIPTRRNAQGEQEKDKSVMTWRSVVSTFLLAISTMLVVVLQKLVGGTDTSDIKKSVDELKYQVATMNVQLNDRIDRVDKKVDGFIAGFKRPPRL